MGVGWGFAGQDGVLERGGEVTRVRGVSIEPCAHGWGFLVGHVWVCWPTYKEAERAYERVHVHGH